MEDIVLGRCSLPFPFPIMHVVFYVIPILIISVYKPFNVSAIFSNIQATYVSPIYYRSVVPSKTFLASLVYAHSPYLSMSFVCIGGVIYFRFNILIRPYLVDTSASYLILYDINHVGFFLVIYVKGLKLFPLSALFIARNTSLIFSKFTICVVAILLVL